MVHYRKTTAVQANVSVSTSAIGVVYFGAPGARKDAHFIVICGKLASLMLVVARQNLNYGFSYLYISNNK